MLKIENTVLVIVDVQGKLASLMHKKGYLFKNINTMIDGARLFDIPIIWMEQTPDKLGGTVAEIKPSLEGLEPIVKSTFSCCDEPKFTARLDELKRKQILLCGIETHVCVYQTAVDLLEKGYEVEVVSDAVSSRFKHNKKVGLERIVGAGGRKTSTEMALFELQKRVEGERFRKLIKIIK